jgi:hypothetical protein
MADKEKVAVDCTDTVDRAEAIAHDLLAHAVRTQVDPHELLMSVAMAQRLLERTVFPGNPKGARLALQEGHAVFDAVSTIVTEVN